MNTAGRSLITAGRPIARYIWKTSPARSIRRSALTGRKQLKTRLRAARSITSSLLRAQSTSTSNRRRNSSPDRARPNFSVPHFSVSRFPVGKTSNGKISSAKLSKENYRKEYGYDFEFTQNGGAGRGYSGA